MAEPVTLITEPRRQSCRFEDNVTVIRTFNPDKEKMVAALRRIVNLTETRGESHDSNKMSSLRSEVS